MKVIVWTVYIASRHPLPCIITNYFPSPVHIRAQPARTTTKPHRESPRAPACLHRHLAGRALQTPPSCYSLPTAISCPWIAPVRCDVSAVAVAA